MASRATPRSLEAVTAPSEEPKKKRRDEDALVGSLAEIRAVKDAREGFERMADTVAMTARFNIAVEILKRRIEVSEDPKKYMQMLERLEMYKHGFDDQHSKQEESADRMRRQGKEPNDMDWSHRPERYTEESTHYEAGQQMDNYAKAFEEKVQNIIATEKNELQERKEVMKTLESRMAQYVEQIARDEKAINGGKKMNIAFWDKPYHGGSPQWNELEEDRMAFTAQEIVGGKAVQEIESIVREYTGELELLAEHRPSIRERVKELFSSTSKQSELCGELGHKREYLQHVLRYILPNTQEAMREFLRRKEEAQKEYERLKKKLERLQKLHDLTAELVVQASSEK